MPEQNEPSDKNYVSDQNQERLEETVRKQWSWKRIVLNVAPVISLSLLGLAAVIVIINEVNSPNTSVILTALVIFLPAPFIVFDWYVNNPYVAANERRSDSDVNRIYYPDLRLWGYGMVLGAGAVVLYLLSRSTVAVIDIVDSRSSLESLMVWREGILLFFLSSALAFVMYALVGITRSER